MPHFQGGLKYLNPKTNPRKKKKFFLENKTNKS